MAFTLRPVLKSDETMHASLQNSAQLTHHMSADARNMLSVRKQMKKDYGDGKMEYLKKGKWMKITDGLSVGRKRLHQTERLTTEKLRMVVKDSIGHQVIKRFAVY